jgi:Mn2+/Fe2+ NRAMP family transporter
MDSGEAERVKLVLTIIAAFTVAMLLFGAILALAIAHYHRMWQRYEAEAEGFAREWERWERRQSA